MNEENGNNKGRVSILSQSKRKKKQATNSNSPPLVSHFSQRILFFYLFSVTPTLHFTRASKLTCFACDYYHIYQKAKMTVTFMYMCIYFYYYISVHFEWDCTGLEYFL